MPKSKEQFEAIRLEREQAILHASLFLFATKGYEATTADDIAAAVKCSHGLLYHYFPTKQSLIQATFDKVVHPLVSSFFNSVDYSKRAKEVIEDLNEVFFTALKSNNDEYAWSMHLLLNLHLNGVINPSMKKVERKKKLYDHIFELIERGKAEGDFKDLNTRELVITLLAMFKGLAFNRIMIGYKKFICPHSDIIMSMLLK